MRSLWEATGRVAYLATKSSAARALREIQLSLDEYWLKNYVSALFND